MKKLVIRITVLLSLMSFMACEQQDEGPAPGESILPERFGLDIPSSISSSRKSSTGRVEEGLNGGTVYQHLAFFIFLGEQSSDLVGEIIRSIAVNRINRPMTLSYKSDDDDRVKNLVVVEGSSFEAKDWQFELTITDSESESNDDGGMAMQIFWNQSPIKGVAIIKPYNIDRRNNEAKDAIYRVDYDEAPSGDYDVTMEVSIAGLPLEDPANDPYSMDNLKMFVGKKGDFIDVFGNSNHPNAKFFTEETGFNWAFSASGSESTDIGVAEVGLPPSILESGEREVILGEYALKAVFTKAIKEAFPQISDDMINAYLVDTDAPGYFGHDGFIQGGTAPSEVYAPLEGRLEELTPYSPATISGLALGFK